MDPRKDHARGSDGATAVERALLVACLAALLLAVALVISGSLSAPPAERECEPAAGSVPCP